MNFLSVENTANMFTRFSLFHFIWIGVCILICLFMFLRRRTIIRNFSGRWYYIFMAFFAFFFEMIYIVWAYAISGEQNIIYAIPFDFTFIAMVLSILLFFSRKQIFYDLFYFISFFSIINLIFADFGGYGYTHFRFYQFFICNIFVVFSLIYFTFVDYHNIKHIKSVVHYGVFIFFVLLLNGLLSFVSQKNYINEIMCYIPAKINAFAGNFGSVAIITFICIALAFVAFAPWYLWNKEKESEHIVN